MSVVLVEREIVHYEVLGRGKPVVFLHGWTGSWRYWIPSMQTASKDYRAYALDLWGFGDTARQPSRYTLDHQVGLLDGFLYEMGILKCALIGHGLGAMVAMQYAVRHSQFVDRVMAVGYPMSMKMVNEELKSMPPEPLADWLSSREPTAEVVREDAHKIDVEAASLSWSDVNDERLKKLWQECSVVSLMVYGDTDPAVATPNSNYAAMLPPTMHLIRFPESGHFPMFDEAEKFHRLMAAFLALPSGESPRSLHLTDSWRRRVR